MENPELRSEYEYREEELRTYRTDIEESRKEGRAEGRAEGKEEEKLNTAKNMLKKGMAMEMIAEITALPIEQIRKIAKEHGYQ